MKPIYCKPVFDSEADGYVCPICKYGQTRKLQSAFTKICDKAPRPKKAIKWSKEADRPKKTPCHKKMARQLRTVSAQHQAARLAACEGCDWFAVDRCHGHENGRTDHIPPLAADMAKSLKTECPEHRWPELPTIIALIGTHRSLSSATAEALEIAGVYFGDDHVRGELRELSNYLESILPFPTRRRIPAATPISVIQRLAEILWKLTEKANGRLVAIKYPSLAAFLPELAAAWPSIRWVHLSRPLKDSTDSLITRADNAKNPRWQATPDECKFLQRTLWTAAYRFFARAECVRVDTDSLLRDPEHELGRIVGPEFRTINLFCAARHIDAGKARHTPVKTLSVRRRWTDETTVIVKTFERPRALDGFLESLWQRFPHARVLVADDSRTPSVRSDCTIYPMPFDSGLSAGRNFLLQRVETPYFFLFDDDMLITDPASFDDMLDLLKIEKLDILATAHQGPKARRDFRGSWKVEDRTLHIYQKTAEPGAVVQRCRFVANCFMGRTETVRRVGWDDRLKVGEHMDFFLRAYYDAESSVAYTPEITIHEQGTPYPDDIRPMRTRAHDFHVSAMIRWGERLGFDRVISAVHPSAMSQFDLQVERERLGL